MTKERACANETLHLEFRTIRDSTIEIIELLHGVDVLAEGSPAILACTCRARALAAEIKLNLEGLAQ